MLAGFVAHVKLYDVLFRPLFAFFIVKHDTREVVHFNVTRSPSGFSAASAARVWTTSRS